jgi:hypothetical protein
MSLQSRPNPSPSKVLRGPGLIGKPTGSLPASVREVLHAEQTGASLPLSVTGGSGTSGGGMDNDGRLTMLEYRMEAVEKRLESMDGKLDKLVDSVNDLRSSAAGIAATVRALPGAAEYGGLAKEVGELKGRVARLPSTSVVAGIVAIAGGVAVALINWSTIISYLKSPS